MNPLLARRSSTVIDSPYFRELERLSSSKSKDKDVNTRIKNIFEEHSDSLIADLIANPSHRTNYREIGANLRNNDSLKIFQSSIGYVQKAARLLEKQDMDGLERLCHQIGHNQTSNVKFSSIIEKLPFLRLPEHIEEIRRTADTSIQSHVFAAIIDRDNLSIKDLSLSKEEFIKLGPYLTYLNCKDAFDASWTKDEIHAFLDSCVHLKILKVNSPLITRLPILPACEIDSTECINLDPLRNIHQRIYESLGEEFFKHLRKGDLHLYQATKINDPQKDLERNIKIHLPGNRLSKSKQSLNCAKTMLADKFLELTKNVGHETLYNPSDTASSQLSESQKNTLLCEVMKIEMVNANLYALSNYSLLDMDQNQRFEILKIAVKSNENFITDNILKFNLTEVQRFEIAKIAAVENKTFRNIDDGLFAHFSKYDIKDVNLIFELVKIHAINGSDVFRYLTEYPFTEDQRFVIAKITAAQKTHFGSIHSYNLIEAHRFEVAQIVASTARSLFTFNVIFYDLSEDHRFEIIKILATKKIDISVKIADYNLTISQRFEIAKIVAMHDPVDVSSNLSKYQLTEDQRFEVAVIANANHKSAVFDFFRQYAIEDQSKLFSIIKMNAANGNNVSRTIRDYNFTHEQRFEIAKISASKNINASKLIQYFDLTESERYEIAKIAVLRFGGLISEFIDQYSISDQNQRFELGLLACEKNGHFIPKHFIKYNLTDDQRLQIIQLSLTQCFSTTKGDENPVSLHKGIAGMKFILQNYEEQEGRKALLRFPCLYLLNQRELTNDELKNYVQTSPYYKELSFILEKIYSQEDVFIRKPLIECLGTFLLVCQALNLSHDSLTKARPLIQELFDFREPNFRIKLMEHVAETLKNEKRILSWENLFVQTENKSFTALMCMFLSPYILKEDILSVTAAIKTRATFQNSHQRNPFLKNLERITSEQTYSETDKQSIFHHLIFEAKVTPLSLLKNSERVSCMLMFGKEDAVKKATSLRELDLIFNNMLEEKLKFKSIENNADKFMDTFGSFKEPNMLFQYAATLMTLSGSDRDEHMDALREFVTNVLEGDFFSLRYDTANNVHLRTIFEQVGGQKLKEEWVKGAIYEDAFSPKIAHEKREVNFDAVSFFKAKINLEDRLNSEYNDLKAVLEDVSLLKEIKGKLEDALKNDTSGDMRRKKIASFQLQAIKLLYPETSLTNQEKQDKIKVLLKTLNGIYPEGELPPFAQDLMEVVNNLAVKVPRIASQFDGFVIRDTDDPERLLNIGDIAGSCQNVNKDAYYSKCLLSYILDGKNRAMIVEDKEGKMIARAILRLVWDPVLKKTALLKEHTYRMNGLDPSIVKVLDESCKRRAAELGLPLVSSTLSNFPYPNPLHSLGGRAPSEYVDSGKGVSHNVWSVDNLYYL